MSKSYPYWEKSVRCAVISVFCLMALAGMSILGHAQNAGDLYAVDSIVGNLRYIPATGGGGFTQGSPAGEACRDANESQFTHVLTRKMAVMETEVTQGMWDALYAVQPTLPVGSFTFTGPTLPVESVTWYEVVLFANLLSIQQGLTRCYYTDSGKDTPIDSSNYVSDTIYCDFSAPGYRLPTEGEWEYFTRAGTIGAFSITEPAYPGTNCYSCTPGAFTNLETIAWFCANASDTTHEAGSKAANPWNLKDVHGNVAECCWDWYGTYPAGTQLDYAGPASGSHRILRAGCWRDGGAYQRSAFRNYFLPSENNSGFGFRLVRTVVAPWIITGPQSQTIGTGSQATLSVIATGDAPLHYQWYQGASGNTSTPVGTDSSWFTTPALTADAQYWVRVTNACGQADSQTATITGSGGPTITSITSKTGKPGKPATIKGSGFSATKKQNAVKFGTHAATVKKASTTKLTVTIPTKCKSGKSYGVQVTANGKKSNTVQFKVK